MTVLKKLAIRTQKFNFECVFGNKISTCLKTPRLPTRLNSGIRGTVKQPTVFSAQTDKPSSKWLWWLNANLFCCKCQFLTGFRLLISHFWPTFFQYICSIKKSTTAWASKVISLCVSMLTGHFAWRHEHESIYNDLNSRQWRAACYPLCLVFQCDQKESNNWTLSTALPHFPPTKGPFLQAPR